MSRPHLRVADVLKQHWPDYCRRHPVTSHVRKVMGHIRDCRSAVLGGHLYRCNHCGGEIPVYNSCQDRHCPTCQTLRKQEWIADRQAELLPVPYFHVVFTLPHVLNELVLANQTLLLREFFSVVAWVLQRFAADPQWKLSGQLGFVAVLHSWTQKLLLHYHLHCLVPGGAWNTTSKKWKSANRRYLFGKDALAKAFQARFIKRLETLRQRKHLRFDDSAASLMHDAEWNNFINTLWTTPWIVYPKATASNSERALDYLGRYTHRVAIGDHRIRSLNGDQITFDWRDRADDNTVKQATIPVHNFISRFILHILPHGFTKVRSYGWLSGRKKTATLAAIRAALNVKPPPAYPVAESTIERIARLTGVDITLCPVCKIGKLEFANELHPSRAGP